MTGHIRRRGAKSWELKFDVGRDALTGRRATKYINFRGAKRQAEKELTRLLAAADKGEFVDRSRMTVDEFLNRWEKDWAEANLSPKTLERTSELVRKHIRPHLGALPVQKLKPATIAELYARLARDGRGQRGGLSASTIRHVHRLLHRALGHAVAWGLLVTNPVASVKPPRQVDVELEILGEDQVQKLLLKLRDDPLFLLVATALATGMRRGELLALRWSDIDLESARVRVERSIEQTRKGLRFKPPKTRHGRQRISFPASLVAELRSHWKRQQEQRLALGLGKSADDALVFAGPDGSPMSPLSVTKQWATLAERFGVPRVTLHGLRHTHASQLIASGIDVLTVARRLGHGSPAVTLNIYGHLFSNTDDKAAEVMEAAFSKASTE